MTLPPVDTDLQGRGTRSSRVFWALALLVLAAAPFWVYSNSLDSPFVGDDIEYIERNPDIRMSPFPGYLAKLRPLNKLTYWLQMKLHKGYMPGYHLVNISLHVLASLLLFFLLKKLLERFGPQDRPRQETSSAIPALAGALLFALHPIQTQAVNYTFARSELLCAVFLFSAMIVHCAKDARRYGFGRAMAVGFMLFLALASKERAFMFVPCLILFDMVVRKQDTWAERNYRWYRLVLPISLVVIAGLINFYIGFHDQHKGAIGKGQEVPEFLPYFWTEMVVRFHYLKLYIWPRDLSFDYHFTLREHLSDKVLLAAVAGHVIGLAGTLLIARKNGLVAFGIFWFFLFLLPTSGVAPAVLLMHEHWVYIPSLGIFLIAAVLLQRLFVRLEAPVARRTAMAGFAGLCILLGFLSHQRNKVWQEPLTLWLDASEHASERAWVWNHIGAAYVDRKEYDKALEALNKAEEIGEPTGATRQCIGLCLMNQGDLEGAKKCMEEAVKLCPDRPEILYGLANLYKKMDKPQAAFNYYIKTMKAGWSTPELYLEMVRHALSNNEPDKARKLLNEGLKLFSDNEELLKLKKELNEADHDPSVTGGA
ncbi:MAG: tetratricopeptide repeat protein [Planctomycetota bacterium]